MFTGAIGFPCNIFFVCLFSTVMTSPGLAPLECTGSCHVNVPTPTDSLTVLDQIEICTCYLGTLSTILQHFTHNESSL